MQHCCRNRESPLGYIEIQMKYLVSESTGMCKKDGVYIFWSNFLGAYQPYCYYTKACLKKTKANK